MRLVRRILAALAVSLLLCAAATPRAWADDNSGGGGGKSIFGHIADAVKADVNLESLTMREVLETFPLVVIL